MTLYSHLRALVLASILLLFLVRDRHRAIIARQRRLDRPSDHHTETDPSASFLSTIPGQKSHDLQLSERIDQPRTITSIARSRRHSLSLLKDKNRHRDSRKLSNGPIVFVHVGKAGGRTLRKAFRLGCEFLMKATRAEQLQCIADLEATGESEISKRTQAIVHFDIVRGELPSPDEFAEKSSEEQKVSFLFNVRNPLDRLESAYNFGHPRNRDAVAIDRPPSFYYFFEKCFPTYRHMVLWALGKEALLPLGEGVSSSLSRSKRLATEAGEDEDEGESTLPPCGTMAREVLSGSALFVPVNHMFHNYQRYLDDSLRAYIKAGTGFDIGVNKGQEGHGSISNNPSSYTSLLGVAVLAVRTENLWLDMKQLDEYLGGNGKFPTDGEWDRHSDVASGKETGTSGDALTDVERHGLCCVVWQEIQGYQDILVMSENLKHNQKWDTLSQLALQCGVQQAFPQTLVFSWEKWYNEVCQEFH